jgi:hypothetical protein
MARHVGTLPDGGYMAGFFSALLGTNAEIWAVYLDQVDDPMLSQVALEDRQIVRGIYEGARVLARRHSLTQGVGSDPKTHDT